MPVEFPGDRAAFLNPDEFGVTASYTPSGGTAEDVDGMFLDEDEVLAFGEPGVVSGTPEFQCQTADLPAGADEGDVLVIGGKSYTVAEPIRHDGTGWSVLRLEVVE